MSLKRFYVENSLANAIENDPPLSAAEAIRNSEQNLSALAAECGRHVARLIEDIASLSGCADLPEAQRVAQIASISARLVGVGALGGSPELDVAAVSLCAVADVMEETEAHDMDAINIHVWTLRQLASGALSSAERTTLLDALSGLRDRLERRRPVAPGHYRH